MANVELSRSRRGLRADEEEEKRAEYAERRKIHVRVIDDVMNYAAHIPVCVR